MIRQTRKRKCKHCKVFFDPDPRNVRHQHYCAQPSCRQASKAASQRRWLHKPENRDYFSGPANGERVRQWRQNHPGYWRQQASQTAEVPEALQDFCPRQDLENQVVERHVVREALQDSFFMQPAVFVGLIAHFTGLSLQEDIALTTRRLQQLGHDILHGSPSARGDRQDDKTIDLGWQTQESPSTVQLD